MHLGESKVSEEVLKLDPRLFEAKSARIDPIEFERRRLEIYPLFQRIGKELERLNALPLQEEPVGSGHLVTTGNYSVRSEFGGFFVTGSGSNKTHPDLDGILYIEEIDYAAGTISLAGTGQHSRETLIHDLIYRIFPDVRTVVHAHDKIALSYDDAPTTDQPIFFANAHEARTVVELLKESDYVHLREHGQFMRADSVEAVLRINQRHHSRATRHRLVECVKAVAPLAAAASIAITIGIGAELLERGKFSDCQKIDNQDGTISYVGPTKINCGSLKSWEGEAAIAREDGQYECRYSIIPGSP